MSSLPSNQKTVYYRLTEKGISLAPIIMEMAIWSDKHLRDLNTDLIAANDIAWKESNKEQFILAIQKAYREKYL